ncbi:jg45, partial [Pararge aegeria aegeria]
GEGHGFPFGETEARPARYTLCPTYQKKRLQIQLNRCLRRVVGAWSYVRNDPIHRDTRTPTVEEFVRQLACNMIADTSSCKPLHGKALLQASPQNGRPLFLTWWKSLIATSVLLDPHYRLI